MESAVHSMWDTLRSTSLSDTATSASVWASDGGHTETTTKLAFSQQNHYIIQCLCNRHTVRGIKKLSSTGAGTDMDTGTDTGAIDNT